VAASGRRLYLALDDGSIRTFALPVTAGGVPPEKPSLRRLTEMPGGTVPRGLAAGGRGLWVLARVEVPEAWSAVRALPPWPTPGAERAVATQPATRPADRAALLTIDAPPDADLDMLAGALGLPPGSVRRRSDEPVAGPTTPPPPDPWRPTDVLLVFARGAWHRAGLPDGWPDGAAAAAAVDDHAEAPLLLARPAGPDAPPRLYAFTGERWGARDLGGAADPAGLVVVQGQRVLLSGPDASGGTARLWLVLPDGAGELATVRFDEHPVAAVALAGHDGGAWLVGRAVGGDAGDAYVLAAVTLRGEVAVPPTPAVVEPPTPPSRVVTYVQVALMVVLSGLLIFVFARRGPSTQRLALEEGRSLASLGRRALAGLVDLAPPVLAVSAVYGVGLETLSPVSLLTQEQAPSWDAVEPSFMAIALFVAHTTLTELTTRQTLGKAMTRLQVASVDGKPPTPWQVLARNVLKAAELIAYLLLLLPLISPFRQRLGDLVARTVVTQAATPAAEDSGDDDERE